MGKGLGRGKGGGQLLRCQPPALGAARMCEVLCLLDTEEEVSLSFPGRTPPQKDLRRLLSMRVGLGWGKHIRNIS